MALSAGSAGIPGYDDGTCQSLADAYNDAVDNIEAASLAGYDLEYQYTIANNIYRELSDNCLVID